MDCPVIPIPEPNVVNGFPYFDPDVYKTESGTSYFKEAGVATTASRKI
jgi:hypothetical protein